MERAAGRRGVAAVGVAVIAAVAAAGCAVGPYGVARQPGPFMRMNPYLRVPSARPDGSVVGRWDNVMLLQAGTPILVLTYDGQKPTGTFASASGDVVRVLTETGEVAVAMRDVIRVERLPLPASQVYGDAAGRGAAVGAGVVGVLGLLAGHMPPARVFAAGAIMGGATSVQEASYLRGSQTIYLAPPRQR